MASSSVPPPLRAARRAFCSASCRAQVRLGPSKAVRGWKREHFCGPRGRRLSNERRRDLLFRAVPRDARALRAANYARRAGSSNAHAPDKIAAAVRRLRRRECSGPLAYKARKRGSESCSGGPTHQAAAPCCSWAPARRGGALSGRSGRCGALGRRILLCANQGVFVPGNARALRGAACSREPQRRRDRPPAVVRSQTAPYPRQAGQWRQARRLRPRRLQRRQRRARPPDLCRCRRSGRPLRRRAMRGGVERPGTASGEHLAGCTLAP